MDREVSSLIIFRVFVFSHLIDELVPSQLLRVSYFPIVIFFDSEEV